jgi:hypothetical protein
MRFGCGLEDGSGGWWKCRDVLFLRRPRKFRLRGSRRSKTSNFWRRTKYPIWVKACRHSPADRIPANCFATPPQSKPVFRGEECVHREAFQGSSPHAISSFHSLKLSRCNRPGSFCWLNFWKHILYGTRDAKAQYVLDEYSGIIGEAKQQNKSTHYA